MKLRRRDAKAAVAQLKEESSISSCSFSVYDNDEGSHQALGGTKRKRKTERDLSYLRKELRKEFLWSREKILAISEKLNLAETQVYKWWWDQTRKRQRQIQNQNRASKMKTSVHESSDEESSSAMIYFPSTDEFGGYSSRLRLQSCFQ